MDIDPKFTTDELVAAQRTMRAALGMSPEEFPLEAFVGMISDEVEQLRKIGMEDDEIARLVSSATRANVSGESIRRYYAPPRARGRET